MSEQSMGYGQIQLAEDVFYITPISQHVKIVRGEISTITLDEMELKMPRDHANFLVIVAGQEHQVYFKGCEVQVITLFDEDEPVVGNVWEVK